MAPVIALITGLKGAGYLAVKAFMLIPVTLLTAGGGLLVLAMCPIAKIAWQCVRLVALLALAAFILVAVWLVVRVGWSTSAAATWTLAASSVAGAAAVGVVGLAPLLADRRAAAVSQVRAAVLSGGGAGVLGAFAWLAHGDGDGPAAWWATAPGYLISAFYLGSVMVAWLLGHRYLTATEMTIDPLRAVSRLLLIAVGARWAYLLVIVGAALLLPLEWRQGATLWSGLIVDWLMVSIRVGVGLILPSAFAFMALECVKLRSTQSATGILFFMSVFVVIGELTSQYLAGQLGYPI